MKIKKKIGGGSGQGGGGRLGGQGGWERRIEALLKIQKKIVGGGSGRGGGGRRFWGQGGCERRS